MAHESFDDSPNSNMVFFHSYVTSAEGKSWSGMSPFGFRHGNGRSLFFENKKTSIITYINMYMVDVLPT